MTLVKRYNSRLAFLGIVMTLVALTHAISEWVQPRWLHFLTAVSPTVRAIAFLAVFSGFVAATLYCLSRYLQLLQKVRSSGRMVCKHCGYDLRAAADARCPECGKEYASDDLDRYWRATFGRLAQ